MQANTNSIKHLHQITWNGTLCLILDIWLGWLNQLMKEEHVIISTRKNVLHYTWSRRNSFFLFKKKNTERECDEGKLCYTWDFHTDSIIFSSSSKLNAVRKVPMCYINLLSNVRKKELGKWVYVHRDGSVSYSMLFGIWISSLKYEKKLELEGCNGALCKAFPLFYDLSSCNFLFLSCYIIVLSKI